jgi:hypothetical protein
MSIWIKPKEGEFNFLEETSREKINLLKFQDIPPNEYLVILIQLDTGGFDLCIAYDKEEYSFLTNPFDRRQKRYFLTPKRFVHRFEVVKDEESQNFLMSYEV